MQIEAGKYYRTRDGQRVGPAKWRQDGPHDTYPWFVGGEYYMPEGRFFHWPTEYELDIIAEWTDDPDAETYVQPEDYAAVPVRDDWNASDADVQDEDVLIGAFNADLAAAVQRARGVTADPSIKDYIADEAKWIVSGARRSAYGTPEDNFGRIARFWEAYFHNTGRPITVTAADVSPLMRLMKEARLCETPDHLDSHIDLVGYTLTGAEVSGVKKP